MSPSTESPHVTEDLADVELAIGGMTCASCSSRVERHLNKVPGAHAEVNLVTETALVHFDPKQCDPEHLVGVVERAGYSAEVVDHTHGSHDHMSHDDASPLRLVVAAICTTPVIAVSMLSPLQFSYWQWVAGVLATVVVLWAGASFHRAGWSALKIGEAGMDSLISIGSLAAWGYSIVALVFLGAGGPGEHMSMSLTASAGDHPVYFEVAAGVVTLILLGRFLEARARRRAGDAVRALLTLQVAEARVIRDGTEQTIAAKDLLVDDRFVVRAGERIPTDGVIEAGSSTIDTSMVTGESLPASAQPGTEVTGGTMNLTGRIEVLATRVGKHTTLAQIADRVRTAQSGKAQIQRLADRVSAVFVPAVILGSLATLGFWLGHGSSFAAAFNIAVAVLIVACPCAMGLATPVALMAGTGRGAQLGILIGGAQVLESTRSINTVVFDKTGTLTTGQMSVAQFLPRSQAVSERAQSIAHALESSSNHPIAAAIVAHWAASAVDTEVTGLSEHAGLGLTATVDGSDVFVGSPAFAAEQGSSQADIDALINSSEGPEHTIVMVGWDGAVQAAYLIADTIRDESAATVSKLHSRGLTVKLLTGDRVETAHAVATRLGISHDDVIAEVRPTGKADAIAALQASGAVVAMVGDGINDAPALAQADLGISMGGGSDVAIQASDITLIGSDIGKVGTSLVLARRTLRTIQGNLFWAFAYNVLAIPLAASGNLNPLIAAAAMAFSSLFVVLNSLRLKRFKP